jgi:outer membrane protein TolC
MRRFLLCFFFLSFCQAQQGLPNPDILTLEEYLGLVKLYHPVAKQADLKITEAQAKLLKARGAFDPKIEVDWDTKEFKTSDYYNILNSSFKIPTWFGIELAAGFERNTGVFLNPENNVPQNGLYKAGISIPLGQGLFINDRMAGLRQAQITQDLNEAERQLQINDIIYDASLAYFEWFVAYKEVALFENVLEQAEIRLQGIKRRARAGDLPGIDTLEAGIIQQTRALSLEKSSLKLVKKRLELSNFLWIGNNIPVELAPTVDPQEIVPEDIDSVLSTNLIVLDNFNLEEHPKIRSLNFKLDKLNIERRLKAEMLKPQLDLKYNFLNENISNIEGFNVGEYTFGLQFKLPIFLRKERGDLRLTKAFIQSAEYDLELTNTQLNNKISAVENEILSYNRQVDASLSIVDDSRVLLRGEERKFSFGESSIFLINSREVKLIESQIKYFESYKNLLDSKAKLFNVLALEF